MKTIWQLALLALCLGVTGCKHTYVWNEYPIAPNRISATQIGATGKDVKIVPGKSSEAKIDLGNVGFHHYYGSEQQLTEALVRQLATELKKRGVENAASSAKSMEVAVTHSRFETGMWRIAGSLDFTVKLGDAQPKSFSVRNSSPGTVARTYNGAVALAVIEILNDPAVLDYLKK